MFQKILQNQQKSDQPAETEVLKEVVHNQTTMLISKQVELFQQHTELLTSQHAESMKQMESFGQLLEHRSKVVEVLVATQLLQLIDEHPEAREIIEFLMSFLDSKDLVTGLRSFMAPSLASPLAANQPSLPEIATQEGYGFASSSDALYVDEQKRLAEEAEQKRIAEEAEQKRIAEEAEQKRIAEEAAKRGAALEAEGRRIAEEAAKRRVVLEAEGRRIAEEAARRRAAELKTQAKPPASEPASTEIPGKDKNPDQALYVPMNFEQQRDEEARMLLDAAEQSRQEEQLDETEPEAAHSRAASNLSFDDKPTIDQPFSEAFMEDANKLFKNGKYAEAEKYIADGLPMLEELIGREHISVVDILYTLGTIGFKRGKYADAEKSFQEVLERRTSKLGGDHPATAQAMNDLGQLYIKTAKYKEAKKVLTEALDLRRRIFSDEHRDTAQSCHALGTLYLAQGLFNDAFIMLDRAFSIRKMTLGENHLDSLQSKNELGKFWLRMNRMTESGEMLSQALNARKEQLGEDHPEYAEVALNFGEYLSTLGRYEEAQPLLEHALKVKKKGIGERHPETAATFNRLGVLHLKLQNYDTSKSNLNQSLYIRKTSLGEVHPETAESMHDFGMLYWSLGTVGNAAQKDESLRLLEKSFHIRNNLLGEQHPDTLQSVNSIGTILTAQGDVGRAEPLLRTALVRRRQVFGANHLSIAESDHALALCYLKLRNFDKAKSLLDEELRVKSIVLGADSPLVARTQEENQNLLTVVSLS
jgi:tetratricopeptide (TPR) repeat protein